MKHAMKSFASAMAISVGLASAASAADVEVLHWWTSGGEAAALDVLKQNLAGQGTGWVDMPVAGGGGEAAMTTLRARVTAGDAPTAVQMLGFDILDWAKEGALADLTETATSEGWDKVVPAALQSFSTYDGKWIAAPVNVHSTNWIWINKAALDAAGGKAPESWDELVAVLDAMKANGIVPLGHGGQAWQDATIFDAVVLSMGTDFYKAAFIDLDPAALSGPQMVEAFDRMAKLRTYVDDNFSGRDWNLASAMVINGEAGMQMMGDWAKGQGQRSRQAGRPGADGQGHHGPGLPVGLQRGQGLGPGAHRRAERCLRRLRQEGHGRPRRGEHGRHALRFDGARPCGPGGGEERRL